MTTGERLVIAATGLLDLGGEKAVTLRAVGHASGISHNAPYKHFRNRDALLAAVATADFSMLAEAFRSIRKSSASSLTRLMNALRIVIEFSVKHPARYQLLFNDPAIAAQKGELEQAAFAAFSEFVFIVQDCKATWTSPETPDATLAGLLFATMHGLIAMQASGRMHAKKGLTGVESSLELLVQLLSA